MIKCIYIDRTSTTNKHVNDKTSYYGDIHEIEIPLVDFNIEEDKFQGKPVPFFNRDVPTGSMDSYFPLAASNDIPIAWCRVDLYDIPLIMIYPRPRKWTLKACLELDSIWKMGNPKATQINKYHRIWGPAIFCRNGSKLQEPSERRNITKDEFIKTCVVPSVLKIIEVPKKMPVETVPKNKIERHLCAQKWLKGLIDVHILTYEDAYILFGTQINYEYVDKGYIYCQAGPCFHSVREFANLMCELPYGASINTNHSKTDRPSFLWDVQSTPPMYPADYKKYNITHTQEHIQERKTEGDYILLRAKLKKKIRFLRRKGFKSLNPPMDTHDEIDIAQRKIQAAARKYKNRRKRYR